jgi:hypothetical protein
MTIQPLTTEQESQIPVNLIAELRNRNVFLMVGAGLSIPLGFPSWDKLIVKAYEKIQADIWDRNAKDKVKDKAWLKSNCNSKPDWAAEILKFLHENSFREAIIKIFKEVEENGTLNSLPHALISLIPFRGFITTNFDNLLEKYLNLFLLNSAVVYDYNDIYLDPSRKFSEEEFMVYKIHGSISKGTDSLILSSTDYYRLLHDERYIRFLDSLFSKNIILTVGYSLRDRDFRSLIEERYNLYQNKCAPMYSLVGRNETCEMEIDLYRKKYNIHLIPMSEEQNYSEITSLLLSLYCLVYQVDSSRFGQSIIDIVLYRLDQFMQTPNPSINFSQDLGLVKELMAVFQEPVDIDLFTTICVDKNLSFSPAHLKAIFSTTSNKIFSKQRVKPNSETISFVANWLSNYFQAIPLGKSSRYFSIFHKKFLRAFLLTISYLLSTREGWQELIGDNDESALRLRKFNEFFRQEGNWIQWLHVTSEAELFLDETSDQFLELMKTKMWIYFWTRRFSEAKSLLSKYPQVDEGEGQYSYQYRLQFMDIKKLPGLVKKLETKKSLDFFNISLLGRSYARLSLNATGKKKEKLLNCAKSCLEDALEGARLEMNNIEVSVQSWYLGLVCSELNEFDEANKFISETRRLDESIMDRKPGKAWLKLAEFRLGKINTRLSEIEIENLKGIAIHAMNELGIIDAENYVERDFFY